MADTADDLARYLSQLADAVGPEQLEAAMTKVGVESKRVMAESAARDLGGDNRFSGWPRAPLTTGFEHTAPGSIVLQGKLNGPWQVAEQGRGPSRRGRTRGKRTWSNGVAEIGRTAPQVAFDALAAGLGRVGGGRRG